MFRSPFDFRSCCRTRNRRRARVGKARLGGLRQLGRLRRSLVRRGGRESPHSCLRRLADPRRGPQSMPLLAEPRPARRSLPRIPIGTSRSLLRHPPFPFYVDRAQGVHSTDLDGNQRLDFHNNYTTMIHGHGHPKIQAAVARQLERGTSYSAPGAQEYELVELLCNRIDSVEQVVFNNSGTEAVMLTLRIARAHTGRNRIGKFEGGYHGFSDFVMVGGHELPAPDDPVRVSVPTADVGGLPAAATDDVGSSVTTIRRRCVRQWRASGRSSLQSSSNRFWAAVA